MKGNNESKYILMMMEVWLRRIQNKEEISGHFHKTGSMKNRINIHSTGEGFAQNLREHL